MKWQLSHAKGPAFPYLRASSLSSMNKALHRFQSSLAIATLATLATGCSTNPENLRAPSELTCIFLKEPLAPTGLYGLLKVEWTTRLERGPYWSERVDEKGTFFRGPPGGVSIRRPGSQPMPGVVSETDGGFYIPNDPKEPVRIYQYITAGAVPVEAPSDDLTCANLVYTRDPTSLKVSLMTFAAGGAVGGAAGGVIGRSANSGSGMSYGQAAGAGAAGGAIAGLIVASMINAEVGNIADRWPVQDQAVLDKLRQLAVTREYLKQVPSASQTVASPPEAGAPGERKIQ